MPHRALIITSDPKLRQDIENSLLELSWIFTMQMVICEL